MRRRGRVRRKLAKRKYLIPVVVLVFMILLLLLPTDAWSHDHGAPLCRLISGLCLA